MQTLVIEDTSPLIVYSPSPLAGETSNASDSSCANTWPFCSGWTWRHGDAAKTLSNSSVHTGTGLDATAQLVFEGVGVSLHVRSEDAADVAGTGHFARRLETCL